MDTSSDVGARTRKLLAQVEGWRQLRHGLLPAPYLVWRGRVHQPFREPLFAGTGAGNRHELEHRPGPEEIEVGGVGVLVVAEAIAGLAAVRPCISDSAEAPFVELDRTFRGHAGADDPVVPSGKNYEGKSWKAEPPGSDVASPPQDEEGRPDYEDDQAGVAEQAVAG